jgi:dipeptidyl aminopeptidase/acylaminoacyl peptidase
MSTITQPTSPARKLRSARYWMTRFVTGLAVVLLVTYLAISALAASILTTPDRAPLNETPAAFGLAFQDVRFPARGGDVEIAGWYIPSEGSHQAVVMVHGKDGSRATDFYGDFVDFAAALNGRGFAVLMIDMRGHGQSGDARYSFGINEQRDVMGAVDWLKGQGFQPGSIGVLGVSMGAASSILATATDPDIGALVADCGYAEVYSVIQEQWRGASGLPDFFLPSTLMVSRLLLGTDIAASRPVDSIDEIAPRPVLIIHGTADDLIPVAHADQLKAANPDADLWVVPGAAHGGSYREDPQAYVERVAGFFERSLK